MSNYVKTVDFASKDALATGNPNKVALGTQIDTEYNNIATAMATKEDSANKGQANGYVPLNGSSLILDGYLTSNIPRKDTANTYTLAQTMPSPLNLKGNSTGTPNTYTSFQQSDGTENGNVGFIAATSTMSLKNLLNGGNINLITTGVGVVQINGSLAWTQANDGSGSGCDADMVDGLHAAAFATASHTHAASDIVSGTLAVARGGTGTTTVTGTGSVVLSVSPTLSGTISGGTFSGTLSGNGASVTSINASNISSGALSISLGGTGTTDGTARNITGRAGVTKTLSTSAPSGGSDGDIWYRY
jgi:hypothetical protein